MMYKNAATHLHLLLYRIIDLKISMSIIVVMTAISVMAVMTINGCKINVNYFYWI